MAASAVTVTQIINKLATSSSRPRYAFLVFNLLAEQAGPGNKAGPFVHQEGRVLPLREWIGEQLAQISGRDKRRRALELRVRAALKDQLPDDLIEAQKIVDDAVAEHVRATGADNASRVMGELERCGLLKRHYQGYRTSHVNRGGLRNLVCVLDPDAVAAFRRRDLLV